MNAFDEVYKYYINKQVIVNKHKNPRPVTNSVKLLFDNDDSIVNAQS